MRKLLLLNLGSTSFKCKLYGVLPGYTLGPVLARAEVETIGGAACPTHEAAFALCLENLQSQGCLADVGELAAVGYKAVHGGPSGKTCFVDEAVLQVMERYAPLAPAHNPVYLALMRSVAQRYPSLRQIACFETSFHTTIPEYRAVYGVPYRWVREYGIRRYGFHGSSHQYIAWKMAELAPAAYRVISVHLGGSSSLCAIRDGESIATSMGATPQGGLFNNNRVGDFDAFCLPVLAGQLGGLDEVMQALASQSGLLGLSGVSADLRQVLHASREGNRQAELAVRALVDNTVGYIGMFAAYLGGLDAIVFTGGIGYNSAEMRQMVCDGLGLFGVLTDNAAAGRVGDDAFLVSTEDSAVPVWAVCTDEEYVLAQKALALLAEP